MNCAFTLLDAPLELIIELHWQYTRQNVVVLSKDIDDCIQRMIASCCHPLGFLDTIVQHHKSLTKTTNRVWYTFSIAYIQSIDQSSKLYSIFFTAFSKVTVVNKHTQITTSQQAISTALYCCYDISHKLNLGTTILSHTHTHNYCTSHFPLHENIFPTSALQLFMLPLYSHPDFLTTRYNDGSARTVRKILCSLGANVSTSYWDSGCFMLSNMRKMILKMSFHQCGKNVSP